MSATGRLKSYFLRGLAVLLPTVITISILLWIYRIIQNNISIWINRGIVYLIMIINGDQQHVTQEALSKFWIKGAGSLAGFAIAIILVIAVGAMLANVIGRALWRSIEEFIVNMPVVKQIYPYVKQVTDYFFMPEVKKQKLFSRVVAVEWPRKGAWALGMVTGEGFKKLVDKEEKEFLTVFVATTPSPFTGFTSVVPKEDVIDLGMTTEDAVKFIMSGGVISPGKKEGTTDYPEGDTEDGKKTQAITEAKI